MANRLFIVFTDFDGVEARVSTWGNDTLWAKTCIKHKCMEMGCLDIYAFNRLDRLVRCLGKDDKVWMVSTSCWKRVFDSYKNRKLLTKWAGLCKIKLVHKNRKSFDRISGYEPYTRAKLIKWYLCKYKPAGYVVLDDQYEDYLKGEFGEDKVIHTDQADGLTFNNLVQFRSIVTTWEPPEVSKEREKAFQTLLAGI